MKSKSRFLVPKDVSEADCIEMVASPIGTFAIIASEVGIRFIKPVDKFISDSKPNHHTNTADPSWKCILLANHNFLISNLTYQVIRIFYQGMAGVNENSLWSDDFICATGFKTWGSAMYPGSRFSQWSQSDPDYHTLPQGHR
jgi:hypothetical protein